MKTKLKYELFALLSILIGAAGQLAMKWGMTGVDLSGSLSMHLVVHIILNPYLITGFICFSAGMFIWLYALKGLPLSYAFPLQSIATLVIFLFSWILLKEHISFTRIAGLLVMISGIIVIAKNKE